MGNISLKFNSQQAKLMLRSLFALEICMVILYLLDQHFHAFGKVHHIFDLDEELTLPSWFSAAQLFLIGIVFLLQNFRFPLPKNASLKLLSFIGLGFIFLSLDETVMIHERINWTFRHLDFLPRFKRGHGLWISIYATTALILLTIWWKSILEMWQSYPKQFILFTLGSLILLTGAVGLEIIGYQYLRVGELRYLYIWEVAIEEGLEMMGASVILYAAVLFTIQSG